MTDEKIEEAIRHCLNYNGGTLCWNCPMSKEWNSKKFKQCEMQLYSEIIDYINRLKEENKRLEEACDMKTYYLKKSQENTIRIEKKTQKETIKEIISLIDRVPTNESNELNHLYLLKKNIAERYGVEIES